MDGVGKVGTPQNNDKKTLFERVLTLHTINGKVRKAGGVIIPNEI